MGPIRSEARRFDSGQILALNLLVIEIGEAAIVSKEIPLNLSLHFVDILSCLYSKLIIVLLNLDCQENDSRNHANIGEDRGDLASANFFHCDSGIDWHYKILVF